MSLKESTETSTETVGEDVSPTPASGSGDWRDSIPEEMRSSPTLKDVKDVGSLAKQFIDAQSYMGRSIRIPGEDAGDDQWSEFNDKLIAKVPGLIQKPNYGDEATLESTLRAMGKPEKSDEYSSPDFDTDMPGVNERLEGFKEVAYKHGLTKKQFKGIIGDVVGQDIQSYSESVNKSIQDQESLKREWGEAYNSRLDSVANTARNTGAPDSLVKLLSSGKADSATVKWLHRMMSKGVESSQFESQSAGGAMTPAEADDAISDIMNNSKHPYWDSDHPDHQKAVDKVIGLQRKIST